METLAVPPTPDPNNPRELRGVHLERQPRQYISSIPDWLLPLAAPEPAPAGLLAALAEDNLRQGIPVSWFRARGWHEMADAMAVLQDRGRLRHLRLITGGAQ